MVAIVVTRFPFFFFKKKELLRAGNLAMSSLFLYYAGMSSLFLYYADMILNLDIGLFIYL